MADPWISHAASKAVLDEASTAIGRDVVAACRDEAALATTDVVQPVLLALEIAAFRVLEAEGATFMGAAGHSLGEFSALVAAGVLELTVALGIVVVRGRAMQDAGEQRPGTMTALIGVGADRASELCDEVRGGDVLLVANENSPQQVVISGSVPAIERAEKLASSRRIRAIRLHVAGAFHSPLMDPAVAPLSEAIDAAPFAPPRFPIAANVTGELVNDGSELRGLLKRHVVSPVRWARCATSLQRAGATLFVEAGPGDVLTRLAKRIVPGGRAVAIGTPDAAAALATELR